MDWSTRDQGRWPALPRGTSVHSSTTKTRGGAGPFVPQKDPSFDVILSSTQTSNVQATPYLPNSNDSLSLAFPNMFTASDSLNFTKQHASVRRD
jgi:hypothetical protein